MSRRLPRPQRPPGGPQDMLAALKTIPQNPRHLRHPANWPLALQSVADYLALAPGWLARLVGRVNRYPRPFSKISIKSADGTQLSAWEGLHTEGGLETVHGGRGKVVPREGVILVPGMFSSKDNAIQKARALRLFRDFGYHVLVLDLRGFGESQRVWSTAGWQEAEDIEAAVKHFLSHKHVTKLHIYSESLGAAAALTAAGRAARQGRKLISGSLLAVSPYADAKAEVAYLDLPRLTRDDFFMVHWFFVQLLKLGGSGARDFATYIREASQHHGVSYDQLLREASPIHDLTRIEVPTLILHSTDDVVVPAIHGDLFEATLRGFDNPMLWRLKWGNHCLYEMLDPEWFWSVLREFFDFTCLLPPRPPT